jgi:hypothetical protein
VPDGKAAWEDDRGGVRQQQVIGHGWRLAGLIESGRLKDYGDNGAEEARLFWKQLEAVVYEVRPGPEELLRWGVEDATLHDDLVLSLPLCGVLDEEDWRPRTARGQVGVGEGG